MIPRKIDKPKKDAGPQERVEKPEARWKSTAHRDFVRGHACIVCGSEVITEVAHVRMYGAGGMGRKPDDWRTVPLCRDDHDRQHGVGEITFWERFGLNNLESAITYFIENSPKSAEIRKRLAERKGSI